MPDQWRVSRKCLIESEARTAILLSDLSEKHKIGSGIKILLPVKYRQMSLSGFREEFENVSVNQRPGGHLVSLIGKKHKLDRGLHVKFRQILFSGFREEVENVKS